MRFDELTNEQLEKAKACKTEEERQAFIKEYGIEIDDDMLDDVSGGGNPCWDKAPNPYRKKNECPKRDNGKPHVYEKTGRKEKRYLFFTYHEHRCRYCGKTKWM